MASESKPERGGADRDPPLDRGPQSRINVQVCSLGRGTIGHRIDRAQDGQTEPVGVQVRFTGDDHRRHRAVPGAQCLDRVHAGAGCEPVVGQDAIGRFALGLQKLLQRM